MALAALTSASIQGCSDTPLYGSPTGPLTFDAGYDAHCFLDCGGNGSGGRGVQGTGGRAGGGAGGKVGADAAPTDGAAGDATSIDGARRDAATLRDSSLSDVATND